MSDIEDFEVEHSKPSVTKTSLTFLLEGIDPRDLAGDGISLVDFNDSDSEAGGVREAPTCQELAIEGECLTKQGEHREAIPLLESALDLGTDDQQLMSVLWSLLGNAHFYLGNYEKAAMCHAHDLAICNELADEKNQAQAYCNLGIANRKTGYLQRAKLCYERYLDICDKLDDSRSKSKAHHNLGDLHLTLARLKLQRDNVKLEDSPEAKEHLQKAAEYLQKHLEFVQETQNRYVLQCIVFPLKLLATILIWWGIAWRGPSCVAHQINICKEMDSGV